MCSCYAASRNSDSKDDERAKEMLDNRASVLSTTEDEERVIMENAEPKTADEKKKRRRSKSMAASNGFRAEPIGPIPLKSNLKRSTSMVEMMDRHHPRLDQGMRKVSWSDAHGKDIADVQEFELSEEGEVGGVNNNSCRCAIQ